MSLCCPCIAHTEERNRRRSASCLDGALVGLSSTLVLALVDLVTGSAESTRGAVSQAVLSGNVALGLLLVGLLGSLSRVALNGLGDVVGGVLDAVDGLADEALVGSVGVGSRHFGMCFGRVGLVWFE